MPASMHGATKSQEVYDRSYELALDIELHQRLQLPMEVVSQDRTKFFDLMAQKLINAEKKFMENIPNRLKIGSAQSEPADRTNSFVQGSSWIIQVSLCIMAVWTMEMSPHRLTTGGFIDDSNFRANKEKPTDDEPHTASVEDVWLERLRNGTNKSAEFDFRDVPLTSRSPRRKNADQASPHVTAERHQI